MAREIRKLDPRTVATITTPGRHSDGGGLYLVVDKGDAATGDAGAKRWVFLFRWEGKLKEMGLGGLTAVSLSKAREKAAAVRNQLDDGLNPIEARKANREIPTFGKMADELVATLSRQWRNQKHIDGWRMTLAVHADALRDRRVNEITTQHVLDILEPLSRTRAETASRLRGRIERVLDAARAQGFIAPPWENPARWRGNLKHLMPARQKLSRGHHTALPYAEIPGFMAALRERGAMAGLALEFVILTAARSNEVLGATWAEIDLSAKTWTVPAKRMKSGREHRVPLSNAAVKVLEKVGEAVTGSLVFPGPIGKRGVERALSVNAMSALLKRMGVAVTVHGFRSSFRDWAGEASTFPREIAEAALAHVVGDETERAYRRGDALEKRRKLMEAWASYAGRPGSGSVVDFHARAKR